MIDFPTSSKMDHRRPGVAITIFGIYFNNRNCFSTLKPPTIVMILRLAISFPKMGAATRNI